MITFLDFSILRLIIGRPFNTFEQFLFVVAECSELTGTMVGFILGELKRDLD